MVWTVAVTPINRLSNQFPFHYRCPAAPVRSVRFSQFQPTRTLADLRGQVADGAHSIIVVIIGIVIRSHNADVRQKNQEDTATEACSNARERFLIATLLSTL